MPRSIGRLAATLLLWVLAPSVLAADFAAESATLANGMEIVVISDHRAPVITQLVYYRAGSADEDTGNYGVAHFLEHMMFKGTETIPGGEFRQTIAQYGGRENAFTSADLTAYYQTVAREALELVMSLEADRMHNLVLTDKDFVTEIEVVKEERQSRFESGPGGPFGEALDATAFLAHPYRRPNIGWMHELEALTIDEARDWYDAWYAPNNAILIIAGDATLAEVLPIAERTYGAIPPKVLPARVRPPEPPQLAERRVILHDPRVRQPAIQRYYLAPSRSVRGGPAPALTVLAEILGSSTGPMYQTLVVEQGMASGAGAFYSGTAIDLGQFAVWMAPNTRSDVGEMEAAMDEYLAELLETGVTAHEVARAQHSINSSLIFARDSVSRLARRVGAGLSIGLTLDELKSWSDLINAVTVDDVLAAARAVLVRASSVTGLLLPSEQQS
jgi:zinc protease